MPDGIPVVVLGSHRARDECGCGNPCAGGSGIGERHPTGADDPRGFFESIAVVEANKQSWPHGRPRLDLPALANRSRADGLGIARAVEEIGRSDRPWGFEKLHGRCSSSRIGQHHVPGFRFVGVYRPSPAIAASIERRNGFRTEACAHDRRNVHQPSAPPTRGLGFPIVRLDTERAVFLDRMKELVERALDLGGIRGCQQFVGDTRNHPLIGLNEADVYLAEHADRAIESVPRRGEPSSKRTTVRTWHRDPYHRLILGLLIVAAGAVCGMQQSLDQITSVRRRRDLAKWSTVARRSARMRSGPSVAVPRARPARPRV